MSIIDRSTVRTCNGHVMLSDRDDVGALPIQISHRHFICTARPKDPIKYIRVLCTIYRVCTRYWL